ncbi:hypothetical protein T484DRAFT_2433326 [Baffinella frigidus]|nr:hypothetical protein T484DRAFT_2433326 [Cryptophyta sp. CCMP2293]
MAQRPRRPFSLPLRGALWLLLALALPFTASSLDRHADHVPPAFSEERSGLRYMTSTARHTGPGGSSKLRVVGGVDEDNFKCVMSPSMTCVQFRLPLPFLQCRIAFLDLRLLCTVSATCALGLARFRQLQVSERG